jgi:hypothetical protein
MRIGKATASKHSSIKEHTADDILRNLIFGTEQSPSWRRRQTDLLLHLEIDMDFIPEAIRVKLIAHGYNALTTLPNDKSMYRWKGVQEDCGLTNPELIELINVMFPAQQGKNHHPSIDPSYVIVLSGCSPPCSTCSTCSAVAKCSSCTRLLRTRDSLCASTTSRLV